MSNPSRSPVQLVFCLLMPVIAASAVSLSAAAQTPADAAANVLSPVVVTATRIAQPSLDLPVSVDRVGREQLQNGQLRVNLSETLITVPGLSVQNRQNYAQDLQVSVRGFGARSSFGVRGVRLYADGIPGTMPDGQGQFSQFDIGSADGIEVLRGPFSALYGNSSGGVIAIFTEDGIRGGSIDGSAAGGSLGTQRYGLKFGGDTGQFNYVLDAAHFKTDGFRDHSEAERNNFNGKVRWDLGDGSQLTLVGNAVQTPEVQDPLGLTRSQWTTNPEQAGSNALTYNTRKSLRQGQGGATYRRPLGEADVVQVNAYAGHRSTTQFQAILAAAQGRASHPGGVIDLGRDFWGLDARLEDRRELLGSPLLTTLGLNYDDLQEARRGYLNFIGDELGVKGGLRRDDSNHVYDFDQYLQVQWDPGEHWRVIAGVRNSEVRVRSINRLSASGVQSGVSYSAVNPVGGITYRITPHLNVYASYGRGFETPTLNDVAYRSTDGSVTGLNLGLKPARSDNTEIGLKAQGEHWRANLAGFHIKTEDELAVLANSGGRSVFQNIGETTRRGVELSVDAVLPSSLSARLAFTHIRAVNEQTYTSCAGLPCAPVQVAAGNRLPAVPMNSLYAGLTWSYAPFGLTATVEAQGRAKIYVDDRNTDSAPGFWVTNARIGLEQTTSRWKFGEAVRVDNLANRAYVGSVIVNESNSRFFEPSPGRTFYVMFNAARRQ